MWRSLRCVMLLCTPLLAGCATAGLEPQRQVNETLAAAAPSQGRPAGSAAVLAWRQQVSRQLESKKRYPAAGIARQEEGIVYLLFRVDRQGRLASSHIVRSSGFATLDKAALELVRQAQPFPPPPSELPGPRLNVSVEINYAFAPCDTALGRLLWRQCKTR